MTYVSASTASRSTEDELAAVSHVHTLMSRLRAMVTGSTAVWPRMGTMMHKLHVLIMRVLSHMRDIEHWPMAAHDVRTASPLLYRPALIV